MIPDVFICHTPQDRAVADRMCEFLEAQDIKCWMAHRDIFSELGGDGFTQGMEACRTMVLILSASANNSDSVRGEVDQAARARKVLISFAIERVPTAPHMEAYLKHRFRIDAQPHPMEQHFELLAKTLKPLTHKLVPKPTFGRTISGTLPAITSPVRQANIPILPSRTEWGALLVSFDFNHIVVAGFPSIFRVRVENRGSRPLQNIEITMESRCLRSPLSHPWPELAPGMMEDCPFEIEPDDAGHFVLRVSVRYQDGHQIRVLTGSRSIRVNASPNADLINRMKKLLGMSDPAESLPSDDNPSQGLSGLLTLELPELFEPMDLALDYELSAQQDAQSTAHRLLQIPRPFLGVVSAGKILKLKPLDAPTTAPHQEIRLVARMGFSLGRSSEESDLLCWFWPRNEVHDVKTRRISKRHCTLEMRGSELYIMNTATMGNTIFDGEKVPDAEGMPLRNNGLLDLSGIYFLEVSRRGSHIKNEPAISNIDDWAGPRDVSPSLVGGSMRFLPVAPHVLPQNSTWLLSDATFGVSRANGVLLELKGLGEVQGRFYHHRGAFWIENLEDNGAVRIEEIPLEPGSIIPLQSGQTLQLGESRYRVMVER